MIKVNVNVNNKSWKKRIERPENYFKKKVEKISKVLRFFKGKKISFTILLTNSSYMKKLNKKFRNKNKSTDVLSFPFHSYKNLKQLKTKKIYLGDIAISYEKIKSKSLKNNFFLEFDKIWVHGLLHLLGYKHDKNKDFFKMSKVEKKILNLIN